MQMDLKGNLNSLAVPSLITCDKNKPLPTTERGGESRKCNFTFLLPSIIKEVVEALLVTLV